MKSKISSLKLIIVSLLAFLIAFSVSMVLRNNYSAKAELQVTPEGVLTGVEAGDSGKIEIPVEKSGVTITSIAADAFKGRNDITSVTFAEGSQIIEIGDNAFFGTGIKEIILPASLEKIGALAFSQCQVLEHVVFAGNNVTDIGQAAFSGCTSLKYVELPDNAAEINFLTVTEGSELSGNYGGYTFMNSSAYLIVKDVTHYNELIEKFNTDLQGNETEDGEDSIGSKVLDGSDAVVTYPITIYYRNDGINYGSEDCLSVNYNVKVLDGKFVENEYKGVGYGVHETAELEKLTWYYNGVRVSDRESAESVNAVLSTVLRDEVEFYTRQTIVDLSFTGRTDLVFDETTYDIDNVNVVNSLLTQDSSTFTDAMKAEITEYYKPNTATPVDKEYMPPSLRDAGKYTIVITVPPAQDNEGGESSQHTVYVVIQQKPIDITKELLDKWKINGNSTFLETSTFYVYTYRSGTSNAGKEYLSTTVLSSEQIDNLRLNATFSPRTVLDSAVKNSGTTITVSLSVGEWCSTNIVYTGTATESRTGRYSVSATIRTADSNYEFIGNAGVVDEARGFEIVSVTADHTAAVVSKTWYIVNVSNMLVNSQGRDYALAVSGDYTFGSASLNFPVPQLEYSEGANVRINITLHYNGNPVDSIFNNGAEVFRRYINSSMPVGSYRMEVSVTGVTGHDNFVEYITFNVNSASFMKFEDFHNSFAGNNTFTYEWENGVSHYFEKSTAATEAYNAFIENENNNVKPQGVWADQYANRYGAPEIMYSLDGIAYYSSVSTIVAGEYKVYYKFTAPNYYDSTERLPNDIKESDCYFTVIVVESVVLPTIESKTYTGNTLKADVINIPTDANGNPLYKVIANNGGISAGMYEVTLELNSPKYYMWAGQSLNTKTERYTMLFEIEKYTGNRVTTLAITTWTQGKYDKDIGEGCPIEVGAVYGDVEITIVSVDDPDNAIYKGANGTEELISKLKSLKAGSYLITATIIAGEGIDDFDIPESRSILFQVFEKDGLPWWAVLIIVVGALGIVALVLFILHRKGTLQLLFGKVIIAMRAKATMDATIAAVRANKVAEQSRKTVAKAEALDRIEALRTAQKEEKLKPADEQAATLEEKAQAAAKSAELMQRRANDIMRRADTIKQQNAYSLGWGAKGDPSQPSQTQPEHPEDGDTEN